MTVLVDYDFSASAGTWSSGTAPGHSSVIEGWNWEPGVAVYDADTSGSPGIIDFTSVTTGTVRLQWDIMLPDAVSSVGNNEQEYFYLLPAAAAVSSANSACTIALSRNSGISGVDANNFTLNYRATGGFVEGLRILAKQTWYRFRVDVDVVAKTFSLYLDGQLILLDEPCPNAAMTNVGRFATFHDEGTDCIAYVDNLLIESDPTVPSPVTLISDDFTARSGSAVDTTTPDTDARNTNAQKWRSPDNTTTYGVFTRTASGLQPTASKKNSCLARCASDGTVEAVFTVDATEANRYAGVIVRNWDGPGGANGGTIIFRYWGGSANKLALFVGATTAASDTVGSFSGTVTVKVTMEGSFLWCYINGALQFGGPVDLGTVSGAARGLIAEENCGVYIDCSVGSVSTSNYCTSFTFTGTAPSNAESKTIGSLALEFDPVAREGYHSGLTESTTNLFWSRGIQHAHFAEADVAEKEYQHEQLFSGTNVLSFRQRGNNFREDIQHGYWLTYATYTRRGIWFYEAYRTILGTITITPDLDLRPDLWSKSFLTCGSSTATSRSAASFQNWTNYETAQSIAATQAITASAGSTELRVSTALKEIAISGANPFRNTAKYEGVGDPLSIATAIDDASTSAFELVEWNRAMLLETGSLSLDSTTLTEWRDSVATPGTLSYSVGSAKTDASGDADTDGFNELYGWFECTASGNAITVTNGATKHKKPQFRVHGLSVAVDSVDVAGSPVTAYVDALGDGTYLVQIDADVAASAAIAIYRTATPNSGNAGMASSIAKPFASAIAKGITG